MFANAIAYDLIAITPEEKQEVADTIDSIIGKLYHKMRVHVL